MFLHLLDLLEYLLVVIDVELLWEGVFTNLVVLASPGLVLLALQNLARWRVDYVMVLDQRLEFLDDVVGK